MTTILLISQIYYYETDMNKLDSSKYALITPTRNVIGGDENIFRPKFYLSFLQWVLKRMLKK